MQHTHQHSDAVPWEYGKTAPQKLAQAIERANFKCRESSLCSSSSFDCFFFFLLAFGSPTAYFLQATVALFESPQMSTKLFVHNIEVPHGESVGLEDSLVTLYTFSRFGALGARGLTNLRGHDVTDIWASLNSKHACSKRESSTYKVYALGASE